MQHTIVRLKDGLIQGSVEKGISVFKGVPYAKPPVGDLRWKPPVKIDPWTDTVDATGYPASAWQLGTESKLFINEIIDQSGFGLIKRTSAKWFINFARLVQRQKQSEDCLYLNIRAPEYHPGDRLPVMVWIHGGDHQDGSGNGFPYETDSFCHEGVILVTINYRLGVFGYLCHPDLSAESELGASGNYGTLDQIAALQWIQDNISDFGGDPNQVTIFGESAGGESVAYMLTSPLAEGLFARAIIQSGANSGQMQHQKESALGHESGEFRGETFADNFTSAPNQMDALRRVPASEIMAHIRSEEDFELRGFFPVIDGYVLPMSPFESFRQGTQADVPLLVGSNSDEGSLFAPHIPIPLIEYRGLEPSPEEMENLLSKEFLDDTNLIKELYPGIEDSDYLSKQKMLGDSLFGAPAFYYARLHAQKNPNTFLYYFNQQPPSEKQTAGAYHAAELGYVFDLRSPIFPKSKAGKQLAKTINLTWAEFARSGRPNNSTLPTWPAFIDESPQWMLYGSLVEAAPVSKESQYRVLNHRLERQLDEIKLKLISQPV